MFIEFHQQCHENNLTGLPKLQFAAVIRCCFFTNLKRDKMANGVIPGMRDAEPIDDGLARASFSFSSMDKPSDW